MKILFVQCSNSGIAYWRLYNPWVGIHRNRLAEAKVLWWQKDLKDIHPWQVGIDINKDFVEATRINNEFFAYVSTSDVIICQMVHSHVALQYLHSIKYAMEKGDIKKVPILVEIDDDITNTPSYNPAAEAYKPGSYFTGLGLEQFKSADAMIVSTPYLKELYSEFSDHIYVVPNAIDFELWGKTQNKPKPGIRVGWVGGASHDDDLEIVEPVIKNIVATHPEVKFCFVHGASHSIRALKGVEYIPKWARIDKYPQHIASQDFDIGIAPLRDSSFNRAKSNLRWLEYSALKVPTVASNVGHFKETITHSKDGFLADTSEQFEHYLLMLIEHAKQRKAMGVAAYQKVYESFNIDKVAKHYVECLKEVIKRGVVKKSPSLNIGFEEQLDDMMDNIKPLPHLELQ